MNLETMQWWGSKHRWNSLYCLIFFCIAVKSHVCVPTNQLTRRRRCLLTVGLMTPYNIRSVCYIRFSTQPILQTLSVCPSVHLWTQAWQASAFCSAARRTGRGQTHWFSQFSRLLIHAVINDVDLPFFWFFSVLDLKSDLSGSLNSAQYCLMSSECSDEHWKPSWGGSWGRGGEWKWEVYFYPFWFIGSMQHAKAKAKHDESVD